MRYTKPTISSYSALAIVKSEKGDIVEELNQLLLTDGPAYQSIE
jgi:hypothetical protein